MYSGSSQTGHQYVRCPRGSIATQPHGTHPTLGMLRTWSNRCPLGQPSGHCSITCVTTAQGRATPIPGWPGGGRNAPARTSHPPFAAVGPLRSVSGWHFASFRYPANPVHPGRSGRIRGRQSVVPDLAAFLDARRNVHYRTTSGDLAPGRPVSRRLRPGQTRARFPPHYHQTRLVRVRWDFT